jgi:type II secretory pathway pseudopilin PulG
MPLPSRLLSYPRRSNLSGLSRSEVLVLITVVIILVAVAYGPVADYLTHGKVTRGVESAQTLNTLLSQYATDNNGVYPIGEGTSAIGTSKGIARNLLENNFTPDASIFAVGSTPKYEGPGGDYSRIAASNISWDFTGGPTASTGITSSAPDLLPILYTTGESVAYPTTPGSGLDLALSGRGPFGKEGVIVAYKNNSAKFIPGIAAGTTVVSPGFISKEFKDPGPYTQIKP